MMKLNSFGIFFLFYLAYLDSLAYTADQISSCDPSLNTPGWTVPKGDIILEYGQALNIYCILDMHNEATKGRNASYLMFYKGGKAISLKYVTVLNETTALLNISQPLPSREMYYCKLKIADEALNNSATASLLTSLEASTSSQMVESSEIPVCLNEVAVGYAPKEVTNFTCVSYNWESLVCTWQPPPNYIPTTYRVFYKTPGRSGRKTIYECPTGNDNSNNKCIWNLSSSPLYRRTLEYLRFTVVGENALGNITIPYDQFHHFAHIIPAEPANLKVLEKTISSVYLEWSIGLMDVFEKGLTYKVQYMWNSSYPAWKAVVFNQRNVTKIKDIIRVNVTGLLYPNVMYDFRISSKSSIATGENFWSPPASILVKTKPCAPYIAPKTDIGSFEISQAFRTHRDVYIYWKPLLKYEQNGEDFHYEVTAMDENNESSSVVNSTSSYAKFANLKLHGYRFFIQSVNREGTSLLPSEIYVPSGRQSIQEPQDFTKIDFGNGVYELSWKLPNELKNKINNFTVFWCESNRERPYQCDGYLDWEHLPAHMNIHNFTVNSNTAYQFAISANTAEYTSSGMVWASCTVLHDKVGKMKNVWVNKIGSDFIEVGWKLECSDRVEGIEGYQIFYCPTISTDDANCKEPEQNITITGDASTIGGNVTNLKPYTRYKISTAVFTKGGGPGPRSDDLFNHTLDGAPDTSYLKINVTNVSSTSATIIWDSPVSLNGVFQYYDIRYNERSIKVTNISDTKVTLNDLKSYSSYNITVLACTKLCSIIDHAVYVQTRIGVPGIVSKPAVNKINSSHARVSWNAPLVTAGPHNTYHVLVQRDDMEKNVTVYEWDTNDTEAQVPIPVCEGEKRHLTYTFYVRAENVDKGKNDSYIGDWSPAHSINCIQSGSSVFIVVLLCISSIACIATFIFFGKRSMYSKCKKMKQVEVTLPPNFTIPTPFEAIKEDEYGVNRETWSDSNNELHCFNTHFYEVGYKFLLTLKDEPEHISNIDELDKEEIDVTDADVDPYSSGCCTGPNSTSSSITGTTHVSDSGVEMDHGTVQVHAILSINNEAFPRVEEQMVSIVGMDEEDEDGGHGDEIGNNNGGRGLLPLPPSSSSSYVTLPDISASWTTSCCSSTPTNTNKDNEIIRVEEEEADGEYEPGPLEQCTAGSTGYIALPRTSDCSSTDSSNENDNINVMSMMTCNNGYISLPPDSGIVEQSSAAAATDNEKHSETTAVLPLGYCRATWLENDIGQLPPPEENMAIAAFPSYVAISVPAPSTVHDVANADSIQNFT